MISREQEKALESQGYIWEFNHNVAPQPTATYYTKNKITGEVVAIPNLPADPYSLAHYLRKGFTLNSRDVEP